MTKIQALFVLYLRHKNFCDCSWRALAGNYYERYDLKGNVIPYDKRIKYDGMGGNQIEGILLDQTAYGILRGEDILLGESFDLDDCDLTLLNINLKRHIEKCK
jgi:hypothetical protein